MRFRIRPGFKLFRSVDESVDYEVRGPASGIVPRCVGGDVVNLTLEEVRTLSRQESLGKLEPVDAEAIAYFGNTKPVISRTITNPELYARPAPEPERTGADWRNFRA